MSWRRGERLLIITQRLLHGDFQKFPLADDANTLFQMTLVSGTTFKLQYKTDNLAGTSYSGIMRITDIKNIRL